MLRIELEDLENKKEFACMFEITRNIIFEVHYYTLGSNGSARFTTSANELNRPKSNYKSCGQGQENLLPSGSLAMKFFKKWDKKHWEDLTDEEYKELIFDLGVLDLRYNARFYASTPSDNNIHFYEVVTFSKLPLKPKPKIVKVT